MVEAGRSTHRSISVVRGRPPARVVLSEPAVDQPQTKGGREQPCNADDDGRRGVWRQQPGENLTSGVCVDPDGHHHRGAPRNQQRSANQDVPQEPFQRIDQFHQVPAASSGSRFMALWRRWPRAPEIAPVSTAQPLLMVGTLSRKPWQPVRIPEAVGSPQLLDSVVSVPLSSRPHQNGWDGC